MVSNVISINQLDMEINPLGFNKILGFKGKFSIPFAHIKNVSMNYGILNGGGGWRLAGTSFFGKNVGLYSKNGIKAYINLKKNELPILIEVVDEEFDQLVLGIENPEEFIEKLKQRQPQIPTNNSKESVNTPRTMSKVNRAVYYMANSLIILGILVALLGVISGINISPSVTNVTVSIALFLGIVMVILAVLSIILVIISSKSSKKGKDNRQE